ncbi:MAG: glycosyltransferase family 4 protein [Nitrospiraceae bacterium]|nr:glycosyltransferase family 4 protein [Nitrospiraceae bacterium]
MIDRRIILEARTLVEAGHRVDILAGFECAEGKSYTEKNINIHRFKYDWDDERLKRIRKHLPENTSLRMFVNRLYMAMARGLMEVNPFEQYMISKAISFDADIYHVHDLPCLKAACLAARIKGVPLIYDSHEIYYAQESLPGRWKRKLLKTEKKYIKSADAVITVNEFISKKIHDQHGINAEVIMNCADLPQGLSRENAQARLRGSLGLPEDCKIVLYQGWISGERNIETLVYGARYFPERTYLVIIGYGAYEETLREIMKKEGLEDRVFFLGPVDNDEILNYTAAADLAVIPYLPVDLNHLYCSPNKLFEYIVAGTPIVSHDLPFLSIIGNKYKVLRTVDMRSAEAFGRGVSHLISNKEALNEMKENCLIAAKELNWAVEGQKLLSIYEKIFKPREN